MQRTHRQLLVFVTAGLMTTLSALPHATASEVQVARYSTVPPTPTRAQHDPLAAPVLSRLPASVTRVGEAIETLLEPSGYRLSAPLAAPPARAQLLDLPLPEVHRTLSPLPLRTALRVLVGPSFTLIEDPVHRLVSFQRCASGLTQP